MALVGVLISFKSNFASLSLRNTRNWSINSAHWIAWISCMLNFLTICAACFFLYSFCRMFGVRSISGDFAFFPFTTIATTVRPENKPLSRVIHTRELPISFSEYRTQITCTHFMRLVLTRCNSSFVNLLKLFCPISFYRHQDHFRFSRFPSILNECTPHMPLSVSI